MGSTSVGGSGNSFSDLFDLRTVIFFRDAFICSIRVWRKARRRIYLGRISGYGYRVYDLSMTKRGKLIVPSIIVCFVRP